MDWVVPIVCLVAFAASILTFFSGFGLGTVLLPAFACFFPIEAAVAMTAVVHLGGNVAKFALMARHAEWPVVGRFGVPAVAGALLGAGMLGAIGHLPVLASYSFGGAVREVTPLKLVIASLMGVFAVWELWPRLAEWRAGSRWLPVGGFLSGFFGGLSGHQGALRSAFLLRVELAKEALVGTGVVVACLVDVTRLAAYGGVGTSLDWAANRGVVLAAVAAALGGALLGARLLRKVTLRAVQKVIGGLLLALAAALAAGLV